MSPDLAPGALVDDRYRVVRLLGSGSTGRVYQVRDPDRADRRIALKLLTPCRGGEAQVRRFFREFHILSRLSHPNLVTVHDTGLHAGVPYFTMEWAPGRSLDRILASPGSILGRDLRGRLDVLGAFLSQVCSALEYIHGQAIVHRDLKPANLILYRGDSGPLRVKVTDLGLASRTDEIPFGNRGLTGTAQYLSPEQVRGRGVDGRADLYALGVVIYEILAGRPPFDGGSLAEVALRHLREVPAPLRQVRPDLPIPLQQCVSVLLEKEPFHRYASASELAIALGLEPAGPEGCREGTNARAEGSSAGRSSVLLNPRFVGRTEELAALRRLLEEAGEGRGSLAVLTGGAGIGKTALLDEFGSEARLSGFDVLTGVARGPSGGPLHPIVQALSGFRRHADGGGRAGDSAPDLLADLLPDAKSNGGASRSNAAGGELAASEGHRVQGALIRFLRVRSRRRPIALLVEDAHEADGATLEFLRRLGESLSGMRMVACAAFRTDIEGRQGPGDPAGILAAAPPGKGRSFSFPLGRLAAPEVARLVRSMAGERDIPRALMQRLQERAGGNPLFAIEAVKVLADAGRIPGIREAPAAVEDGEDIPGTLHQVILRRLAGLEAEGLDLLRCGSVIGGTFDFDVLMGALGREEMALTDGLERLRRGRVIREEIPKQTYRFVHGIVRDALYEAMPGSLRRHYHGRVGDAIERLHEGRTAPVTEILAHHFAEAARVEKAIHYLQRSGDRAGQVHAAEIAAGFYGKALQLVRKHRPERYLRGEGFPDYLDLICSRASVLGFTGNLSEADRLARLAYRLARTPAAARQRARARMVLAAIRAGRGNPDEAIREILKARRLFRSIDDRLNEARALEALSLHYWHRGDGRRAAGCLAKAGFHYRSLGGTVHEILGLQTEARAHSMRGDLVQVEKCHRRAVVLCDEIRDRRHRQASLGPLRQIHLLRGDFTEAERLAQAELRFFGESGARRSLADAHLNLGDIQLERGAIGPAEKQYRAALEILQGERYKTCLACCRLSEISLRRGDRAGAMTNAVRARSLADPRDILRQSQSWRVLGMAEAALGQDERAESSLRRSVEAMGSNRVYDLGRAHLEAGRFYRSRGRDGESRRHLREARAIFRRMGAVHYTRMTNAELEGIVKTRARKPGPPPAPRVEILPAGADSERSRTSSPPGGPREVAPLAADRLSRLIEVARSLTATLDLDALLNRAIDLLLEVMRAERGLILLAEPGEDLTIRASRAHRMSDREVAQVSFSTVRETLASGRPIRSADAGSDRKFQGRQSVVDYRIRSVMCVPLRTPSGRIQGALYVDHRRLTYLFSEEDEALLEAFAGLASLAIENAEMHSALKRRAMHLQLEAERRYSFGELIGGSPAMQKVYALIENAAGHGMTVLLTGETGVGKELAARSIHYNSARRKGPFIVQDCGAMPPGMLESELFGHRRGSFTGAFADRIGLFEAADGGTIFLDEVGNTPTEAQSRLLRVLQEGEVRRLGDTRSRRVDVRTIAATNRDLYEEVGAGRFREDLFYRLNAFPIPLPPLRERREDIPMLAGHFLKTYAEATGRMAWTLGREVLARLLDHPWRGNVRELENEVRRAASLTPAGEEIGPEALSGALLKDAETAVPAAGSHASHRAAMEAFERSLIREALRRHDRNVTRTAKALGISRMTLQQKMKRYGLRAVAGSEADSST